MLKVDETIDGAASCRYNAREIRYPMDTKFLFRTKGGSLVAQKELPICPVETTLMLISDRWVVLILRDLLTGTKRFGELKKSLAGISQKVLTAKLRDMESNGLLTRQVYPEVPPRVEYTLTDIGESLKPILGAMFDWGMDYKEKNHSPSNAAVAALGAALH